MRLVHKWEEVKRDAEEMLKTVVAETRLLGGRRRKAFEWESEDEKWRVRAFLNVYYSDLYKKAVLRVDAYPAQTREFFVVEGEATFARFAWKNGILWMKRRHTMLCALSMKHCPSLRRVSERRNGGSSMKKPYRISVEPACLEEWIAERSDLLDLFFSLQRLCGEGVLEFRSRLVGSVYLRGLLFSGGSEKPVFFIHFAFKSRVLWTDSGFSVSVEGDRLLLDYHGSKAYVSKRRFLQALEEAVTSANFDKEE